MAGLTIDDRRLTIAVLSNHDSIDLFPAVLAAAHIHPMWSIALAAFVALGIAWYWLRLGRTDVPASRRKIRRFSIGLMLLSLPMFVRALSFLDPAVHQRQYVLIWTMALFMLMLVMATALLDAINNLRLHRQQRHEALMRTALNMAQDVKARQSGLAASHPPRDQPANPVRDDHA